jgi:hypothetical protein
MKQIVSSRKPADQRNANVVAFFVGQHKGIFSTILVSKLHNTIASPKL